MDFFDIYRQYRDKDITRLAEKAASQQVITAISKSRLSEGDFISLLSPAASGHLEEMAQKAHRLTVQNFGRVISLYTPLYLSNHCSNECVYCGFNVKNRMKRRTLSVDEVEREAQLIAETGLRHILILTGESSFKAPVEYVASCVERLRKYFSSISIEIYPLETEDYQKLISAGVDGFTMYQEVYDPDTYDSLHLKGPKKDYLYRLNAPERACRAGMRTVNLGALLGLEEWRREVFFLGLHARYLQDKYPNTEIGVSFPRIRPAAGCFQPKVEVSDKDLVQMILAFRIFVPRAGIAISTRENADLRDNLIRLGVTRMSAGVCTEVGGRLDGEGTESQFDISDERSVSEMKESIIKHGYQPVFKDWLHI